MTHDVEDDDDIDTSYELAIRKAARYLSQLYSHRLDALGLTTPQFTILRMIARREAWTMAELSQVVVTDRSTLVRAVQVMRPSHWPMLPICRAISVAIVALRRRRR